MPLGGEPLNLCIVRVLVIDEEGGLHAATIGILARLLSGEFVPIA